MTFDLRRGSAAPEPGVIRPDRRVSPLASPGVDAPGVPSRTVAGSRRGARHRPVPPGLPGRNRQFSCADARKKRTGRRSSRRRPFTSLTAAGLKELYPSRRGRSNPAGRKIPTGIRPAPGSQTHRHVRVIVAAQTGNLYSRTTCAARPINIPDRHARCNPSAALPRPCAQHRPNRPAVSPGDPTRHAQPGPPYTWSTFRVRLRNTARAG